MPKMMIATALLLVAFLMQACAADMEAEVDRSELKRTGSADIHAVSDARLRTVMRKIRSQAIDHDDASRSEEEEAEYFSQAAKIADSIEASAQFFPKIGERLTLTPQELETFTALGDKLRGQAEEVRWLAIAGGAMSLRKKMNQTIETCNSCHDLFRTMPKGASK
ncbi:cytochrome c [Mariprofundus sp. NF]|uniref:cytochrome c n=1 Tax=Mariprofundus sp. NF TaxID=2608716 RepID=UPI0015A19213|nr:cytochrome c [Mariprofundus sp. NF]NWF39676.1 cytochrome c [Mariprofundus sp. NF]